MALAAKLGLRIGEMQRVIDQVCAVSQGLTVAPREANVRRETVGDIAGAVASNTRRCRGG